MDHATKVCEAIQDINVLATRINVLYYLILQASKHLNLSLGPGGLRS